MQIFLLGDVIFILLMICKYLLKNLCKVFWVGVIGIIVYMFLVWY
jgi:hypothetical protein